MELTKCKLQYIAQDGKSLGYRNTFECAWKLVSAHGALALFTGFLPTVLRNGLGTCAYFSAYEHLKKNLTTHFTEHTKILISGGLSGAIYWISIYPLDVVKAKIQCASFTELASQHANLRTSFTHILRTEGVRGFWRGFGPCLLRSVPVNATTFLAFETTRKFLDSVV